MKWDEEKFGLEYDLDIFNVVAVNDFNMGAMENKGLNVFNTAFVLAKPGAGKSSFVVFFGRVQRGQTHTMSSLFGLVLKLLVVLAKPVPYGVPCPRCPTCTTES